MNKQHKKPRCDDMYRAILTLKTVEECKQFFDDLCTVTELQAMEQRYQVAQYLDSGLIYNPETTMFLKKAIHAGANTQNGLSMLHLQAERAWEIWNSAP